MTRLQALNASEARNRRERTAKEAQAANKCDDAGQPRDRWGRPLIVTPDGSEATAYTRVSTLAKACDDLNNLMAWQQRKVIEGVVRRPDLLTRAAGALANGNPDTDWPTKRALNDACKEAREAAGASTGASAGTGFHSLTEAIDRGEEPLFVPPADVPRLDAYREATKGIEWLGIEQFVVNDQVQAAGTFDRLARLPDGRVVVADLKSGKSEADYPLGTTTQIATYALGRRYDPATGARASIHEDLDVNTGLLIHLPPSGGCRLLLLDLRRGWEAARTAAQVLGIRKWKADELAKEWTA